MRDLPEVQPDADDVEATERFKQAVGPADVDSEAIDFGFARLVVRLRQGDPVEWSLAV